MTTPRRRLHWISLQNLSMQYTENFFSLKKWKFHWKNLDSFLIFAQNIDCGYTLEPPQLYTVYTLDFVKYYKTYKNEK